jgi:hypothetical protein
MGAGLPVSIDERTESRKLIVTAEVHERASADETLDNKIGALIRVGSPSVVSLTG